MFPDQIDRINALIEYWLEYQVLGGRFIIYKRVFRIVLLRLVDQFMFVKHCMNFVGVKIIRTPFVT